MMTRIVPVLALGALSLPLAAQTDPVGTWIVRPYGAQPAGVLMSSVVRVDEGDQLTIFATGAPGAPLGLLFSQSAAQIPLAQVLGGGTVLVEPSGSVLSARFDENGIFLFTGSLSSLGIQLFYLQLASIGPNGLELSLGHELELWQSGLFTYQGPPLQAQVLQLEVPTSYQLNVVVQAPTTGWSLKLSRIQQQNGLTDVYMILERPGPHEPVLPVVTPVTGVVNLGTSPGYAVKLLVAEVVAGMQAERFELAAIMNT